MEERQSFRFRLPWLHYQARSRSRPITTKAEKGEAPPDVAAETQIPIIRSNGTVPDKRPPFRPPGIAPAPVPVQPPPTPKSKNEALAPALPSPAASTSGVTEDQSRPTSSPPHVLSHPPASPSKTPPSPVKISQTSSSPATPTSRVLNHQSRPASSPPHVLSQPPASPSKTPPLATIGQASSSTTPIVDHQSTPASSPPRILSQSLASPSKPPPPVPIDQTSSSPAASTTRVSDHQSRPASSPSQVIFLPPASPSQTLSPPVPIGQTSSSPSHAIPLSRVEDYQSRPASSHPHIISDPLASPSKTPAPIPVPYSQTSSPSRIAPQVSPPPPISTSTSSHQQGLEQEPISQPNQSPVEGSTQIDGIITQNSQASGNVIETDLNGTLNHMTLPTLMVSTCSETQIIKEKPNAAIQQNKKYGKPDMHHKHAAADFHKDITNFVHSVQTSHLKNHNPINLVVITLAGENRGASMQISTDSSSSKERSVHIRRNYNTNPDQITTTDDEDHQSSMEKTSKDNQINKNEDQNVVVYINNNVQGINNAIVLDSCLHEKNAGVHLELSQKPPIIMSNDKITEKLTYQPRVRRRCLRGLLMESSDSDPEKPLRHGCRVGCRQKNKGDDTDIM